MPKPEVSHVATYPVYASVDALCEALSGLPPEGERVYQVLVGDERKYVSANSPKSAAELVCEVERVPQKELLAALGRLVAKSKGLKQLTEKLPKST